MSLRSTMRWLLPVLLVAGAAVGAPAGDDLRIRVQGLLGSYRPVTVAEWRALGPAAAPVLEAAARDTGALPTWRARALAALGVVQPAAAAPLVRQLATDRSVPPLLRSSAIDAAPGVLGADAVGFLTPLLRDADPGVRQRSAEALATTGAAGCRAVVNEARTRSPGDPLLRTAASCDAQRASDSPAGR